MQQQRGYSSDVHADDVTHAKVPMCGLDPRDIGTDPSREQCYLRRDTRTLYFHLRVVKSCNWIAIYESSQGTYMLLTIRPSTRARDSKVYKEGICVLRTDSQGEVHRCYVYGRVATWLNMLGDRAAEMLQRQGLRR